VNALPLLIVEDSPVYAEILQRLLPTLGSEFQFDVKWVDSAESALEELQTTGYELVLLDYKLPGADGLTVLAAIRNMPAARQPAVIMLTGMGREEIAVEAMKRGAKDYLPKDALDMPSLMRAISGALERKNLEARLARSTEELRQKNAEMLADLSLAREVQEAFLPQHYPRFKHDALRFHHRYLPTATVGGDFFDVLPLSESAAGVFICDVMGHGVRAALVTAVLRGLVEELRPVAVDPGEYLTGINRGLISILHQTRMPMFASAFYLIVDTGRGELRFANAGHPYPYHVQRSRGRVQPLSATGTALGVFDDSKYETASQPLAERDMVVLFTDGVYEVDSQDGEQYGAERLLEFFQKRTERTPVELFDELLSEVTRHAGGNSFIDDVCLVGIEAARVGP
jgi:serine phosphatase RsbU (regulator of sigma subunit)/CheY-like chemotaxis protein